MRPWSNVTARDGAAILKDGRRRGRIMNQKAMRWTGWALTGVFVLFMLMDVGIKLMRFPIVDETMVQLGFRTGVGFWIGILETILLILYVIPRTAVLGAILFMGIFGGAIAIHLRNDDPLLTHVLFGLYLGPFMWGGLWLRDPALRSLFPVRATAG